MAKKAVILKAASKKKYLPNSKEKYMCAKHKKFFSDQLVRWKKDIIKANNLGNLLNSSDDNMSSADMVDQASSYTDKSVEMKALNRSRKLIAKIDLALRRLKDGTYGYCEETGEPIGLKRLMARPIATLTIEAQEKHERDEKIFVDD
jgi:DnaK suppressor protein